jgi:hypothetical protein
VQGAARNCLLVKGGSSFNALVRALKQDLIDSGTAAKDPALLYQIDKVREPHAQSVYGAMEARLLELVHAPCRANSSQP